MEREREKVRVNRTELSVNAILRGILLILRSICQYDKSTWQLASTKSAVHKSTIANCVVFSCVSILIQRKCEGIQSPGIEPIGWYCEPQLLDACAVRLKWHMPVLRLHPIALGCGSVGNFLSAFPNAFSALNQAGWQCVNASQTQVFPQFEHVVRCWFAVEIREILDEM